MFLNSPVLIYLQHFKYIYNHNTSVILFSGSYSDNFIISFTDQKYLQVCSTYVFKTFSHFSFYSNNHVSGTSINLKLWLYSLVQETGFKHRFFQSPQSPTPRLCGSHKMQHIFFQLLVKMSLLFQIWDNKGRGDGK